MTATMPAVNRIEALRDILITPAIISMEKTRLDTRRRAVLESMNGLRKKLRKSR
jgi:hypothetical protein